MRKLLLLFLLLALPAIAQVDVKNGSIGPYVTLTRNAVWGSGGIGKTNNAYIFAPLTTQSQACVYIANNNPTSAHAFTITFFTTGDPLITGYFSVPVAQQDKWRELSSITDTVIANGINVYSFTSLAAASAMFEISATSTEAGSPDTADFYIVQASSNIDCSTSSVPIAGPVTVTNNVTFNSQCPLSLSTTIATATKAILVAGSADKDIHVCAYTVASQLTASPTGVLFANGTTGACTSLGTTLWDIEPDGNNGGVLRLPGSLASPSQIFQTTTAGQPLCIDNTGTGYTATVNISYSIS